MKLPRRGAWRRGGGNADGEHSRPAAFVHADGRHQPGGHARGNAAAAGAQRLAARVPGGHRDGVSGSAAALCAVRPGPAAAGRRAEHDSCRQLRASSQAG